MWSREWIIFWACRRWRATKISHRNTWLSTSCLSPNHFSPGLLLTAFTAEPYANALDHSGLLMTTHSGPSGEGVLCQSAGFRRCILPLGLFIRQSVGKLVYSKALCQQQKTFTERSMSPDTNVGLFEISRNKPYWYLVKGIVLLPLPPVSSENHSLIWRMGQEFFLLRFTLQWHTLAPLGYTLGRRNVTWCYRKVG